MSRRIDALVADNLPLVGRVAGRSFPGCREDPDLLQCGRIALWQAALRWDGSRPFRPFACACIHNAMARWLQGQARPGDPPCEESEAGAAPDWHESLLEDLALRQRIEAAWPPGTPEHRLLTALAAGVPKTRLAARTGRSTWEITRAARRAWSRVPL